MIQFGAYVKLPPGVLPVHLVLTPAGERGFTLTNNGIEIGWIRSTITLGPRGGVKKSWKGFLTPSGAQYASDHRATVVFELVWADYRRNHPEIIENTGEITIPAEEPEKSSLYS